MAQSSHPKDKNKSNTYRTSSLPPLGLRAFLSRTYVHLGAPLDFWHTEVVRDNTAGIWELHRTAAEEMKQTQMNEPQKAM